MFQECLLNIPAIDAECTNDPSHSESADILFAHRSFEGDFAAVGLAHRWTHKRENEKSFCFNGSQVSLSHKAQRLQVRQDSPYNTKKMSVMASVAFYCPPMLDFYCRFKEHIVLNLEKYANKKALGCVFLLSIGVDC